MTVENVGGAPLKFKTPNDLQKVCDKYFKETPREQWTITGLALLVGSKQLIQDYEKREYYKSIIHRAKLMVENSYELSLRKNGSSGDIFALKNFGWSDKQEIEHQGKTFSQQIIVNSEEVKQNLEKLGEV